MKKTLLTFTLLASLVLITSCASTPKPINNNVGALMGYMEVFIGRNYGVIQKGTYKYRVLIRLEEKNTGQAHFAYNENGYYTFHNLNPGIYSLTRWKLSWEKNTAQYKGTAYFWGAFDPVITVEIKPKTVTMLSKIKQTVEKNRKDEFVWDRYPLKSSRQTMEKEFLADPKNEFWKNYKKEYIKIK